METKNNSLETFGYFSVTDSGKWGKAFESSLKAYFHQKPKVSKQGKIDFRRDRKCFEVKTGAGELDYIIKSKIKYIVFVPVVNENIVVEKQEGFIFKRETFLDILEKVGLIRTKISTSGQEKVTIQTFYNHSKNKPHGKKYFLLLDECYNHCLMDLSEYFNGNGKFNFNENGEN